LNALFWHAELLVNPGDPWRWPNYPDSNRRWFVQNGSMGVVVLISNRTSGDTIDTLWSELTLLLDSSDGLEVLVLEDSLREPWSTSIRPEHVSRLMKWRLDPARGQETLGHDLDRLQVVWRRHQSTLSNAEVGAVQMIGCEACEGLLFVDVREDTSLGSGGAPAPNVSAALRRVASHALSTRQDMPGLNFLRRGDVLKHLDRLSDRSGISWAIRKLSSYLEFHRRVVQTWAGDPRQRMGQGRALVFVCNPMSLCGGHGDRTNGILSTFVLALLTNRAFFIDFDSPLPLNLLLQPRRMADDSGSFVLDWRLRGGGIGLGSQVMYIDDRIAFQEDLSWLVRDPSPVLLVSMNHRELGALMSHPLLEARARELELPGWPHLASQLWNVLFEPTPLLRMRLVDAQQEMNLPGPLPWEGRRVGEVEQVVGSGFIGIHFRAGNESARLWWDPGRHALSMLPDFLECAARAESELRLPRSTKWFLSADTRAVLELVQVAKLRHEGKLVVLDEDWQLSHVDRSHVDLSLAGFIDSYVSYYLLASARAVVLSRSYFGETAAEVGAVPDAYFAEGCVRTDLHAS